MDLKTHLNNLRNLLTSKTDALGDTTDPKKSKLLRYQMRAIENRIQELEEQIGEEA